MLVSEAIESYLSLKCEFKTHLVIVNDGCPFEDSHHLCQDYARSYPELITYLIKENGGLSSARNYGVEYAFHTWQSAEAFYFLDADNRLRAPSLNRAYSLLKSDPAFGWVYPNIDMFGLEWAGDYGGNFSVLIQSYMNACEAGSLVSRKLISDGVRFDEKMRLGFEDWEFFLSASAAGYKGVNEEFFGFRYRRRPESMLAESHRDQLEIKAGMFKKHDSLNSIRKRVALEQRELPRYAIYLADDESVIITTDPAVENEIITLKEYEKRVWLSIINPSRYHCPAFLVVTTSKFMAGVGFLQLRNWIFWRLEDSVLNSHIATLSLSVNADSRISLIHDPVLRSGDSDILMVSPKVLRESLTDHRTEWISSIATPDPLPITESFELQVPAGFDCFGGNAVRGFNRLFGWLWSSEYRRALDIGWEWRAAGTSIRNSAHLIARENTGNYSVFPKTTVASERNIGFVLPVLEFGGVEKTVVQLAAGMKKLGWRCHLLITDRNDIFFDKTIKESFDSIQFLDDETVKTWSADENYFGTTLPAWGRGAEVDRAFGAFYWFDVIVNCHGAAMHALMGKLKRWGVITVSSLHLSDKTVAGRSTGNTYLTLAYEHAYHLITTCSYKLADWCHALGIPEDKIVPLPNSFGFNMSEKELSIAEERRRLKSISGGLNILYLGRLDSQKGIDILDETVALTKGYKVNWRILGKSIVEATEHSETIQGVKVEPPIYKASDLAKIYDWADVLVITSRYEGLPLTAMEAMRSGVVVISTRVGAVDELISDSVNGFLVGLQNAAADVASILERLNLDSNLLRNISRQSVASVKNRSWSEVASVFSEKINSLRAAP